MKARFIYRSSSARVARYNDRYDHTDNHTGEDCDAIRDQYLEMGGYPVSRQDRQDDQAWEDECRKNNW